MSAVRVLVSFLVVSGLVVLLIFTVGDRGEEERMTSETATATPPEPEPIWLEVRPGAALEVQTSYVLDTSSGTLWQLSAPAGLPRDRVDVTLAAWSPNNQAIVTYSVQLADGAYTTSNIAAPGQPFDLFNLAPTGFLARAIWSPDGRFVATGQTAGGQDTPLLQVMPLTPETRGSGLQLPGVPVGWSGDSRFLMLNAPQVGGTSIWDSETGSTIRGSIAVGAWAHDGARLAYVTASSGWSDRPQSVELRLRDFASGADALVTTVASPGDLSWSGNDGYLALSYVDPEPPHEAKTLVIDVATGTPRTLIASSRNVSWSPVDDTLLFLGNICGGMDVFTVNADGSRLRNYTRAEDVDLTPQWSPAGDRVAFVSVSRGLMEIAMPQGTERQLVAPSPDTSLGLLGWSPDGRYLSFAVGYGTGYCEGAQPETTEVEVLS